MKTRFPFGVAVLLLGAAAAVGLADGPPETRSPLFSNGNFTKVDAANWPVDWPRPDGVTFGKEGDTPFLRLQSAKAGQMVSLYRRADLPTPPPAGLEVRLRVRHADIQSGQQPWHDGRVIAHFKNRAGRVLKPEPPVPSFRGSSTGWVDRTYFVPVPVSAASFEIMPCLFQTARGTLDVAQCLVLPATAEQLAAARPKVTPSETLVPAQPESLPPVLRVAGKQLQTADGKAVWLQGLCVDSLEWSAAGEKIAQSIPVAVEQWKANVIRLPVRDDFWFGRGKFQGKDGGLAYIPGSATGRARCWQRQRSIRSSSAKSAARRTGRASSSSRPRVALKT